MSKSEVSHTIRLPEERKLNTPPSLLSGAQKVVLTVFLKLLSCNYLFFLKLL